MPTACPSSPRPQTKMPRLHNLQKKMGKLVARQMPPRHSSPRSHWRSLLQLCPAARGSIKARRQRRRTISPHCAGFLRSMRCDVTSLSLSPGASHQLPKHSTPAPSLPMPCRRRKNNAAPSCAAVLNNILAVLWCLCIILGLMNGVCILPIM